MNILVIDGMGGGIGKAVIEQVVKQLPTATIMAVGTNYAATASMLKAGAHNAATGENPVIYNSAKATHIIGPLGIISPNAMHGEISPKMALAISSSNAQKILIPVDKCNITVVSTQSAPLQHHISQVINQLTSPSTLC